MLTKKKKEREREGERILKAARDKHLVTYKGTL